MKQISLTATGFELVTERAHKQEFMGVMNLAIRWSELLTLIAPNLPAEKSCRPPFPNEVMMRMHFLQQIFGHSELGMEEALHDIPLYQQFTHLDAGGARLHDESTIRRFGKTPSQRHLLEKHSLGQLVLATVKAKLIERGLMLKTNTVVDATLIAAPRSSKNVKGERDREIHQTKKGNQWHFGMKSHIRMDALSGLVQKVTTTAANAHDITQVHALLHSEEEMMFADSDYWGIHKREEKQAQHPTVKWPDSMMPGQQKTMAKGKQVNALRRPVEKIKASIRALVEHPLQFINCQFGRRKVCHRNSAKSFCQLLVVFALSDLWIERKRIFHRLQT